MPDVIAGPWSGRRSLPVRCCSDTRDRCVRTEHVGPVSLALHPFIRHGQGHITGGSDETVAFTLPRGMNPTFSRIPIRSELPVRFTVCIPAFSALSVGPSRGCLRGRAASSGPCKGCADGRSLQLRVRLESWFAVACPLLVQQCKEDLLDSDATAQRARVMVLCGLGARRGRFAGAG